MVSVGIDVSKGKSVFCVMKDGEIAVKPQEISHLKSDLDELIQTISEFDDEVKIVMEATGKYHLPVLIHLENVGFFVSVVNPLIMKKYSQLAIRKGKTDKIDSKKIAKYGLDNWNILRRFEFQEESRAELQLLGRQYEHYVGIKVKSRLALITLLDQTMPGITNLLSSNSVDLSKDKLVDFVERYWHYANILDMSKDKFSKDYCSWAKSLGYDFIMKKIAEGKPNKVAKIAGLNKFLRIYYARVKASYENLFLDLEPEANRDEIIHTRRACA